MGTSRQRRPNKWDRRDKKRHKKKHGMRITGRSVFTIKNVINKKARDITEAKENE